MTRYVKDEKIYKCFDCSLFNFIDRADTVSAINVCECVICTDLIDPIDGFIANGEGLTCNTCASHINCDECHKTFEYTKGFETVNGNICCSDCVLCPIRDRACSLKCDYCNLKFSVNCSFCAHGGKIKCALCTSATFKANQVDIHHSSKGIIGRSNAGTGASGVEDIQTTSPPTGLITENKTEYVHNVRDNCKNVGTQQCQVQTVKFKSNAKCCCQATDCPFQTGDFKNCDCETVQCKFHASNHIINQQFGFTPIQKLHQFPNHFNSIKPFDYFQIAKIIKNSQIPNVLGQKFLLPSSLNLPLWHHFLKHYWDSQLFSFLACGFPLDLKAQPKANKEFVNHSSAIKFGPHIQHYLDTELNHSAILGPFSKPITGLHLSPMMTRPKQGSSKRRVIIDLSWPKGTSINDNVDPNTYMGTPFLLKFPTVDDVISRVKVLKGDCLLYKVDLQRAFRQLRLDPGDIFHTGLHFEDQTYVDTAIPFGYRHGSMACQRFTDAIRFIMHQHGYYIANYIDDLIGCDPPQMAQSGYQFLLKLLQSLGVTISSDKLFPPSLQVTCLGLDLDVTKGTLTIPPQKLHDTHSECLLWLDRNFATKRQIQALLGVLLYIHKCVLPARMFVNRILFTLRMAPNTGRVRLNHAFKQDIRWFTSFLHFFNGRVFFHKTHKQPPLFLYMDACLDGLGAYFNDKVYHVYLQDKSFLPHDHSIVHLEMINILVALRTWASFFTGRQIISYCDNAAVVAICQNGRSRDPYLAAMARNIWWLTATCDIDLQIVHISGHNNKIADTLSRWHLKSTDHRALFKYMSSPKWFHVHHHNCLIDFSI